MKSDPVTEALKKFNSVIDLVLKEPVGPKRWRAAHDLLWLNLSDKNRQTYDEVVRDNALSRETVDRDGFGKIKKNGNMRQSLAIPHGAYYTIQKVDPTAFTTKKNAALMHKTFPEYTTRKVF